MKIKDPDNDALLDELSALPKVDVDGETSDHIRRLAHTELRRSPRGLWARVRAYYDIGEPVLVLGAAAIYLAWAIQTINDIYS